MIQYAVGSVGEWWWGSANGGAATGPLGARGLVPNAQKAVPRACAHRHAVLCHAQARHSVIVTR